MRQKSLEVPERANEWVQKMTNKLNRKLKKKYIEHMYLVLTA